MVLYDWIGANNPAEFWKCPAVYHCMLVNHWSDAIVREMTQLESRFRNAILMPHFGPDDYYANRQSSMNLIHQAYHIQRWEQETGRRINQLDTIAEFGGGYGAMALLCHRLGFEGEYVIYDLPEFALLQEYYLGQFGLLDKVQWSTKCDGYDLTIALYSISEVEPDQRLALLPPAKSYLFLYSGQWQEWNNVQWFRDLFPHVEEDLIWQHLEIDHLPDRGNFYSIGY